MFKLLSIKSKEERLAAISQLEQLELPPNILSMNKIMFAKAFCEYRSCGLKIEDFNKWVPYCTIQFTDTHIELLGKMRSFLKYNFRHALYLISSQQITEAQAKELISFIDVPNHTPEYMYKSFEAISKVQKLELSSEQMKAILFEKEPPSKDQILENFFKVMSY